MKKALFFSIFLILYNLSSFSQNFKNQNNTLFQVIYPISISHISNMEFSEAKHNKNYEVHSTFMIFDLYCQKEFNYNITFPSSTVLNQVGGKGKIVLSLSNNMSSSDLIIGDIGKEEIKVKGSFNMTPTTASGVYQNVLEIRVNFQ